MSVGAALLVTADITGARGRYVQARPQAERMIGAAALFAVFNCATKSSAAHAEACAQSVVDALPGAIILKAQLEGDERHAGLL